MKLTNSSIVDTVVEYANVKFGVEVKSEQVLKQLKNISFSETLALVNAIKADDSDKFSDIIDLSSVSEGYSILPHMDREKYQERDGLEGPIMTKSGKVVYYDPKAGSYYDPDTDMYISYDDWRMLDNENMHKEAITPTAATIAPSRPQNTATKNAARDEQNATIRANRSSASVQRKTAGAPSGGTPTGQPNRPAKDLDGQMGANADLSQQNAQEIERLKQLAMGKRK